MVSTLFSNIEIYYIITTELMSKGNILLQKAELGKNKNGFHDLPQNDHTYGKAPQKDQYGAREGKTSIT